MEERNEMTVNKPVCEQNPPQLITNLRYQIISGNDYVSLVNGVMAVCGYWIHCQGISKNDIINALESITRYYKDKNDRA